MYLFMSGTKTWPILWDGRKANEQVGFGNVFLQYILFLNTGIVVLQCLTLVVRFKEWSHLIVNMIAAFWSWYGSYGGCRYSYGWL